MQARNGSIIATVIICAVVLLLGGWYGFGQIPAPQEVIVPTAAEIAALISVPEAPVVNTSINNEKVDKLCELTDGCEVYDISGSDETTAKNKVNSQIPDGRDFKRAFSNLVDIDRNYIDFKSGNNPDLISYRVTAATKDDKDNENYLVEIFYKVRYKDEDETDYETAYILVSSTLDEGDYDSLSIEEVDRNFEFD